MLGEMRAGTAMLTLQLRAAEREAAQAEAACGDRDAARDELRGRLAVLVDRRKADLTTELAVARQDAERVIEAAREQAAAMTVLATTAVPIAALPLAPAPPAAPALPARVRCAQLMLQLRAALAEADAAEREEAGVRARRDEQQLQLRTWNRRRVELDAELNDVRAECAVLVVAAQQAADQLVDTSVLPTTLVNTTELNTTVLPPPVVLPPLPATQTPLNVVIDAEAFARVFAAVFASVVGSGAGANQFALPAVLPQPTPAPVKQSFWSHAKHVDVLLLSAAMVIVLVVLAAWLA